MCTKAKKRAKTATISLLVALTSTSASNAQLFSWGQDKRDFGTQYEMTYFVYDCFDQRVRAAYGSVRVSARDPYLSAMMRENSPIRKGLMDRFPDVLKEAALADDFDIDGAINGVRPTLEKVVGTLWKAVAVDGQDHNERMWQEEQNLPPTNSVDEQLDGYLIANMLFCSKYYLDEKLKKN
ncbi:hypothetical protein [Paracoccus marinaquae]|uniref:Uncharacterized protein n=1 Tax=Paracoccus marinaquae TaxID=2841926 RepID=A0ABS6ANC0_9RHOB|nr:hypothetical protein [Paracoccus marinaquae]MBU3031602.1 hypothetical protein [Paracoccus marinaquae]